MTQARIHSAIQSLRQHLLDKPEAAIGSDPFARAQLVNGLVTSVEGPSGQWVTTDMPRGVGGSASAPTPGWYVRAGIASCTATVIAMRAAELAVPLRRLEVRVESRSNDCGMIGMDDRVHAGPLDAAMYVVISSDGASRETLTEIVDWGIAHSPMADALTRAVSLRTEFEVA